MKIESIDAFAVVLPFRVAFGHSLASRKLSENLIVRVVLENGVVGYGEGIPRDYVTGETVNSALKSLKLDYAPRFLGLDVSSAQTIVNVLADEFKRAGLWRQAQGAAWCALESAILDAMCRAQSIRAVDLLGGAVQQEIFYGAVVPFCGKNALTALLYFYKLYGFRTIKVKVGGRPEDDIERLKLVRKIMGDAVHLRVDANCAWSADETLSVMDKLRGLNVLSIEQPVQATDLAGLQKITAAGQLEVVADESLCTLEQAQYLAESKLCSGFNIRLSKVGGVLAALEMVKIADHYGINCHLGAQVGESGILSAAGRAFACSQKAFANYEGSDNMLLLKQDLTVENLTVGRQGKGRLLPGKGWGVSVIEDRLRQLTSLDNSEFFRLSRRKRQTAVRR